MFTVKITEIKKNKVSVDITFEVLKDGVVVDTVTISNINPPESIFGLIKVRMQQYESIDSFDTSTLIGEVDLTPTEKTPEQIKFETIAKLTELKHQLDVKFIDQTTYDSEVAKIK